MTSTVPAGKSTLTSAISGEFRYETAAGSIVLTDGTTFESRAGGNVLRWMIDYTTLGGDYLVNLDLLAVTPEPTTALIWSLLTGLFLTLRWRRRK